MILFYILSGMTLAWLAWGAYYQLFFAIAGTKYREKEMTHAKKQRKIAVFIPAYREDAVILSTAESALAGNYPPEKYEVIVIADHLKPETLRSLKALPITVIPVAFVKSSKSRALNHALAYLRQWERQDFDLAVVLDADNVMAPDFLEIVNQKSASGYRAIQGRRGAKNHQSGFALVDAASEDINNHILCKGHQAAGLSARLAGSGMAFEFRLFENTLQKIDALGGFDKEMELRLTQQGIFIHYAENALVWDEKVGQKDVYKRQRGRWMAAQYRYAGRYFASGWRSLWRDGNLDHLNKVLQMTLPPRLLLPGFLLCGAVCNQLLGSKITGMWWLALAANLSSFAIALPLSYFNRSNRAMWLALPSAFAASFTALFWMRAAGKQFLHTPHQIEEPKQS